MKRASTSHYPTTLRRPRAETATKLWFSPETSPSREEESMYRHSLAADRLAQVEHRDNVNVINCRYFVIVLYSPV